MKRILKTAGIALLVLLALGSAGFVAWALDAALPGAAASAALQSGERVRVTDLGKVITFEPLDPRAATGLVFYPGGRVDYRAYAPALRQVAEAGYFVALVRVRLNLAFFDIEAAAPVLADHPEIQHWAVAGHSLGGVAASLFAAGHPQVAGLVYWASYPADGALKDSGLRTMSIYASRDGLSTPARIDESRALVPPDTIFIAIEGGNHAQFGDYGPQSGDNPAEIAPEDQWQQVAAATVMLLELLDPPSPH